jgi:apolipoprotein D and lipocalin family protein
MGTQRLSATSAAIMLGALMLAPGAVTEAGDRDPLQTVGSVDLDRYLGLWYEIASYPAWFQKNCTAVTAEYSRRDDGLIKVINSCRKGGLDGKLKQSMGRAKVVEGGSGAKLKVSFFGPFWGDYWIIDIDPDYRWAVVGVPNRKYLWILSRTPQLDADLYRSIVDRLPAKGFDPSRLRETPQPTVGEAEARSQESKPPA